jgi:hypothetical protein
MSQEDESKVLDELFGASDGEIEPATSHENHEKINFDQEESSEEIEEEKIKKKPKKKTEESNEDSTENDGMKIEAFLHLV